MLFKNIEALSSKKQYEEFKTKDNVISSKVLRFSGVDGYDTYNPSVPFILNGQKIIAVRVEKRDSERSHIRFFELDENGGRVLESKILELQDPFVTVIDGAVILGGVNVTFYSDRCEWKTDFYRMNSLTDIEFITSGPAQMKDIRLLQLPDKRIAVFSRPQGEPMLKRFGCVAKIGFTIIPSLSELTPEVIESAPLLEGQFPSDEWGGANQLYNLKNGLIGVIGHKSHRTFDDNGKIFLHYYGMAFAINPENSHITQTKIFLSSESFPPVTPKRPDLKDVVFVSGIERNPNGTATAYTGISDAQAGAAIISDPLTEYETL